MKKLIASLAIVITALVAAPSLYAASVKMCIVTGDELGDDPVSVTYKGRTIPLCCKSCVKKFNAAPEKYTALLDKAQAKKK